MSRSIHMDYDSLRVREAARAERLAAQPDPVIESIKERPPYPVHIPEHLAGIVTQGLAPSA